MSSPKEGSNVKQELEETQATKGSQSPLEKEESTTEEGKAQESISIWTPVWDDNAQAYYWWNTETNKTTWINPESNGEEHAVAAAAAAATSAIPTETAKTSNPLDFLLDRIDAVVKRKLDGEEEIEPTAQSEYNVQYGTYDQYFEQPETSYAATAHFNARTGRFTTHEDANRLNPENLSIESRAKKQMQYYFDVDNYTEEINNQRMRAEDGRVSKKKQLSRKEVEYFKKMKKEKKSKKAREWLMQ